MNKKLCTENLSEHPFLKEVYEIDIDNPLGKGNFGAVFRAKNKNDNKTYAIKAFFQENYSSLREKCKEINILLALQNGPHVVNIEDFYCNTLNNEIILIMEKGESNLLSKLKEGYEFDFQNLLQLFLDLLTSLIYAIEKGGIVHSDIKPHNIIIFSDRAAHPKSQKDFVIDMKTVYKFCDWGCGHFGNKEYEEMKEISTALGLTENYAAPELLQVIQNNLNLNNMKLDLAKCDVYSLGLTILVACGVDKTMFSSLNHERNSKFHSTKVEEILKKGEILNKYGEFIENLLRRMLAFRASDRPNCKEILQEIKEVLLNKDKNNHENKKISAIEAKATTHTLYNLFDDVRKIGGEAIPVVKKLFDEQLKKNFDYIEKASDEENNDEAHVLLGRVFYEGIGVETNKEKAFEFFKRAALKQNYWGFFSLGSYFFVEEQDQEQSLEYFQKAIETAKKQKKCCYSALTNLAFLYFLKNTSSEKEKAKKLYTDLCEEGNTIAMTSFAKIILQNKLKADKIDPFNLLAKASEMGNQEAQRILAEKKKSKWFAFNF